MVLDDNGVDGIDSNIGFGVWKRRALKIFAKKGWLQASLGIDANELETMRVSKRTTSPSFLAATIWYVEQPRRDIH
jgi:hypothetical protein